MTKRIIVVDESTPDGSSGSPGGTGTATLAPGDPIPGDDDAPPADETDTEPTPPAAPAMTDAPPEEFRVLMVVEDSWTGDSRRYSDLTWRDLPLPCMGDDRTSFGHDGAKLIGWFTRLEKVGTQVWGYGHYLPQPDERAAYLIGLCRSGQLRGFSADLDAPGPFEYDVLFPPVNEDEQITYDAATGMPNLPDPEYDEEGNEVLHIVEPRTHYYGMRVMGGTVLPFGAFAECFIDGALAASAGAPMAKAHVTGFMVDALLAAAPVLDETSEPTTLDGRRIGIKPPVVPPSAWFLNPWLPCRSPLTVTDQGRVLGHLAGWDECHVAFTDQCVKPPRSLTNYAHFHVGEILCDDGERVACGRLTLGTGHADKTLDPQATLAHYDHTGTCAADLVAGEDEYGIWVAGALRPDVTPLQVRKLMASPPSGDWRRIGGNLELIAALCVNVPGFNGGQRVSVRAQDDGLVASMIVTGGELPVYSDTTQRHHDQRVADFIAASLGRPTRAEKLAALRAEVHGERDAKRAALYAEVHG